MNRKPNSKQMARIRALVGSDPEIMCGTPVFNGTRIPVDLVADMLAQSATAKEILEGYTTLNEEMISLAPLRVHVPSARTSQPPSWQGKRRGAGNPSHCALCFSA